MRVAYILVLICEKAIAFRRDFADRELAHSQLAIRATGREIAGEWTASSSAGLFSSQSDFSLFFPDGSTRSFYSLVSASERTGQGDEPLTVHKTDGTADMTAVYEKTGAVAGSIVDPEKGMVIQFVGVEGGEMKFRSTPTNDFPPEEEVSLKDVQLDIEEPLADVIVSAAEGDAIIDVMVPWTVNAECQVSRQQRGCNLTQNTEDAVRALIDLAIGETNQAYRNSAINAKLRLVKAYRETEYSETDTNAFSNALRAIQGTTDGEMDDVHALREKYGADIVAMLIDDTQYCGLAYVGPRKASMFSVTSHRCATGYYSFGHEIAHNLGCLHDIGTSTNCDGAKGSQFGYRAPDASFRTVMGYNCRVGQCDNLKKNGCTRVPYYSNPDVYLKGMATGIAGIADNAHHINSVVARVANYYSAPTTESSTKSTTEASTTESTTEVSTTESTTESSTTESTTEASTTEASTTKSTTEASTTESTSEASTTESTIESTIESTTESTTESSTPVSTTESSTTQSTTESSTTKSTTQTPSSSSTSKPSTTESTTEAPTTESTTESSTTESTTESTTKPSTTVSTTESSTTESTTESSTTKSTTQPPSSSSTTESSTTESTTETSTTESTTESSTTESTTVASTTESTTVASTTESTTEASTTESTTEAPTTESTTESSTTDSTTESTSKPSTTVSTTESSTTESTTESSTTKSTTQPPSSTTASSTTESTTESSTTMSTTESSTTQSTTEPSTTESTTETSTTVSATVSTTTSSGVEYYLNEGDRCPAGHEILDDSECKIAGDELKIHVAKSVNQRKKPEGCHFFKGAIYYNKGGSTSPSKGSGICSTRAAVYYVMDQATECPLGDDILDKRVCQKAGAALNIPFKWDVKSKKRPAGCHWYQTQSSNKNRSKSKKGQKPPSEGGGICKASTTEPSTASTTLSSSKVSTTTSTTTFSPAEFYKMSMKKGCPAGHKILSVLQCKRAGAQLNIPFRKTVSKKNMPEGCYYSGKMFFNRGGSTKSRNGAGVCTTRAAEYTVMTSNRGCPQDKHISDVRECKEAGSTLKFSFKKEVRKRNRPAGCYRWRGRSYFNKLSSARPSAGGGICRA